MPEHHQMSLPLLTLEQAQAEGRAVLEKAHKQGRFIPNMHAAMAHVPGLLEIYLAGYDTLRKDASLTSQEQETIFLTISRENGCVYCMAAHSTLADTASKLAPEVTEAIRNNLPIPDSRLAALSAFTQILFTSRGRPSAEQAQAFLAAGYNEHHMLLIVLALAVKTLSNYSNHLFHTPVDELFAKRRWPDGSAA